MFYMSFSPTLPCTTPMGTLLDGADLSVHNNEPQQIYASHLDPLNCQNPFLSLEQQMSNMDSRIHHQLHFHPLPLHRYHHKTKMIATSFNPVWYSILWYCNKDFYFG